MPYFEHSRAIQLGLNYEDSKVQSGVDKYREGGELNKVRENLRGNITEIDREILREIIARMELFYHYSGVISPEQSGQLLPNISEDDGYMKTIFQAISDLCFRARRSSGIPPRARPW